MRLSASRLQRWMDCPKQVHFAEILGYPEQTHAKTVYGTCVHKALEYFNTTGNVDESILIFTDLWDDPASIGETIDIWPTKMSWSALRDRGIECIYDFEQENKGPQRKVLAAEHKFEVPFGDHELLGYVDFLEVKGKGNKKELHIVDLKTASKTPTQLDLRFNTQFTIYLWASQQPEFWDGFENGAELYEEFKDVPRRGIWYGLWQGKRLDVGPRDDSDIMRLYRVATEIERCIEHETFMPDISGESCLFCSYTEVCAVTLPLRDQIEEAKNAWR